MKIQEIIKHTSTSTQRRHQKNEITKKVMPVLIKEIVKTLKQLDIYEGVGSISYLFNKNKSYYPLLEHREFKGISQESLNNLSNSLNQIKSNLTYLIDDTTMSNYYINHISKIIDNIKKLECVIFKDIYQFS